jgi:hypothetical protein
MPALRLINKMQPRVFAVAVLICVAGLLSSLNGPTSRSPVPSGEEQAMLPIATKLDAVGAPANEQAMGSEPVTMAAATYTTPYRIIYRERYSIEFNSQTAYIVVDEVQLAQIQFEAPSPAHPCVHSGRFDLCPI